MFETLLKRIFGDKHDRDIRRVQPLVDEINAACAGLRDLDDEQLRGKTAEFRARVTAAREGLTDPAELREAEQEALAELMPEAFATVKEACRRLVGKTWDVVGMSITWDMVPYDVQLVGGVMLHEGRIAEMATGEGKTLVATMPLYLNALTGRGAHLVTVNDYLARRDSEWMGEIYRFLGLTVGCIQQGMEPPERREQYARDITYGTNNEFGFDYLRDNMAVRPEHRVQRGFVYAIVDEVDSVLIDEARTPLIISGPVEHSDQAFDELKPLVDRLVRAQLTWVAHTLAGAEKLLADPDKEYEAGIELLKVQRAAPKHKRFMKLVSDRPELKRLINRVELEYLRDKRMHELDEALLYAIDEKAKNVDLLERGQELMSPDDPDQFVVPDLTAQLSELRGRDDLSADDRASAEAAYYHDYAIKNERIHNVQALLKAYALFEKDVEYVVQDGKVLIVDEFTGRLMPGRRYSEGLHQAIEAKEGVRVEGETQTLATITLQNFFRMYEKLAGMTGTAETEAAEFWEIYKLDVAVIPTNKPIDRTDYNDVVYRTKREKYNAVIDELVALNQKGQPVLVGTISVEVSELLSRMLKRRGVKHHVLNAKYHEQEAGIVTQAGQRGSVTIATNMAGRGTDIKLGPGVTDLGGLHILGTERHESRRIDRQLRGRAGRQGDPGSSRFYLSLEDDLMRLFGSDRIAGVMTSMGVQEGEVIEHGMVTRAISRAQKRVEAHNFDIRKHLLEYDNVMNQQRTVVYEMRNQALLTEDITATAMEMIEEVIGERAKVQQPSPEADVNLGPAIHEFLGGLPESVDEAERIYRMREQQFDAAVAPQVDAYEAALPRLLDTFTGGGSDDRDRWDLHSLAYNLSGWVWTSIQPSEFRSQTFADLEVEVAALFRRLRPSWRRLVREKWLAAIDQHWREHLYELDQLKGGIGLRSYGQRDPLIEYKKEAFKLFEEFDWEVREGCVKEVLTGVFVPVEAEVERHPRRREPRAPGPKDIVAQHAGVESFASGGGAGDRVPEAGTTEGMGPVRGAPARVAARTNRNDPCPCGSGKKYKKCHMPIDEAARSRE
jgi:preprotein translocase subunit SecA